MSPTTCIDRLRIQTNMAEFKRACASYSGTYVRCLVGAADIRLLKTELDKHMFGDISTWNYLHRTYPGTYGKL